MILILCGEFSSSRLLLLVNYLAIIFAMFSNSIFLREISVSTQLQVDNHILIIAE